MALTPPNAPPSATAGAIPAGPVPQLQALGEVVVEQVPERIAQLARTILLSGTIVDQQPGGALVLRTQVGELIIRSPQPLPPDKVLTLQIPPGAPPVRAQVSVAQPLVLPAGAQPAPAAAMPASMPVLSASSAPAAPVGSGSSHPPAMLPAAGRPVFPPLVPAIGAAIAAQALVELPIIPGTVLPAQVMALPDPTQTGLLAQILPPPAVQVFTEVQKLGAPALQALLPQGLSDIVRRLPPAVLTPPLLSELPAASASGPGQAVPVVSPRPPLAPPAVTVTPAFASLPVLLTLPPGAQVTVQVEQVWPPGAQPAAGQPPAAPSAVSVPVFPVAPDLSAPRIIAPPPTFTAVVIGQTPQGEPIATSPAGLFVLASRAPLAPGSTVELSLVHVQEPAVEAEMPLPAAPRDWPVLHQALASLPEVATPVLARLARPDNLAGVTAFLVAALRLGEGQRFIGDELAQTLRARGQVDLLTRLSGEIQQAGPAFSRTDMPATDWRSLALPVLPDGQITRLAVHMRHEREAETAGSAVPVKRLVVEIELSRLGPMLLDGHIRSRRLDLMLRSQRRLPRSLRDELRLACRDSLTALGWQGGLEFQTAAELWLKG